MRKRDPNAVIDQFQGELASSLSDWAALTEGTPAMIARRATMDAFARGAVAFERFRSEWHIAAITRDASTFRTRQLNRVQTALKETRRDNLADYVQVVLPRHPTLEQVSRLLDAEGANVSLPNVGAWKKAAERDLAEPWLSKVSGILWAHGAGADAVIAIRNASSHQSERALADMTAALGKLTHPTIHKGLQRSERGVTLAGIPAYLHSAGTSGSTRVEIYLRILDRLGESLRAT